jgi:ribosomal silencing factor RsfS
LKARRDDLPTPGTEPGFDFLESKTSPSAPQEDIPSETAQALNSEALEETDLIKEVSQPAEATVSDATQPTSPSAPISAPSDPSIPWYLQPSHKPTREPLTAEHSAREALPELPPNPPPLLQTLLEYISITSGLDDLQLLDLRHLDPPPALGSKLIMVIGTARSEKHLHVSADRFCRHLRREYGLRANAAGLLGRNELKIKLRRKAKRMKMLANIGGREPEGNLDDGIRTGWICCTVGKIEAHPEDTHIPGADIDNFIGFRDVQPGVTVVVQMFTEEKRAEIDLETLWGGVLRTHERRDAQAEEQLKALEEDVEGAKEKEDQAQQDSTPAPTPKSTSAASRPPSNAFPGENSSSRRWTKPKPTKGDFFPPASSRNAASQLRRIHTVGL